MQSCVVEFDLEGKKIQVLMATIMLDRVWRIDS
jgi:hypothetical protein